jgi:hypothetical protein
MSGQWTNYSAFVSRHGLSGKRPEKVTCSLQGHYPKNRNAVFVESYPLSNHYHIACILLLYVCHITTAIVMLMLRILANLSHDVAYGQILLESLGHGRQDYGRWDRKTHLLADKRDQAPGHLEIFDIAVQEDVIYTLDIQCDLYP